jgi:hypothetical protein
MDTFDPSVRSTAVDTMAKNFGWDVIATLVGGTAAMRAAGEKYLPQFPKENGDAYKNRLAQAVLFPAFARSAATLAAKPLSRPIGLKNLAPKIEPMLSNVDLMGASLQEFAGQVMRAVLQFGLDGVLVDMPPGPDNGARPRTVADEKASGARPYMVRYPATSILGWRAARNAAGAVLTEIRLKEEVTEYDGFIESVVPQIRVLRPGFWETYREVKGDDGKPRWQLFNAGVSSLPFVPFVFFYGVPEGFGIGRPPLLELAHLNVQHWQNASDQQNILHVARVPVLFAKGFSNGDEIVIGAAQAITTDKADADLKYVEHTGAAIDAGRQSIQDLEDRMRQVGAELLKQRPAVVTATQIRSDDEGNRSTLQQIAEEFEESLERCLKLMGQWIGENSQPEVELFKDFGSAELGEKTGDLLLRAAADGHVSHETVFKSLQRIDAIKPDLKWDEEKARLASEAADGGNSQ